MTGDSSHRSELAVEVASTVAAAAKGRVIVVGSLPPSGRDLDVVAREPERARIERALTDAGLVRVGSTFALFRSFSAYSVEVIAAESFLPPDAVTELFDSAILLDGLAPLARPCPAHALLILAGLVRHERHLAPKRRARLDRILSEDPTAWAAAERAAPRWRAAKDLALLRATAAGSAPLDLRRALRGLRRRRTLLVTLSGLDGSGKSSQSRWLAAALRDLGVHADVVWNDLHGNILLDLLGVPVKTLLKLRGNAPAPMADEPENPVAESGRNPRVRSVWSSIVTLTNALEQRLLAVRGRVRGRTVVFDRGPLDLAVRMAVLYGGDGARQGRQVKWAAPQPHMSFLLDVSPAISLTRKEDRWSHGHLEEHARLYRALAGGFGATVVDGTAPPDEIAALIAAAVWRRLAEVGPPH